MSRMQQFDACGRHVRTFFGTYLQCLRLATIWSRQLPYGPIVIE